MGSMQIVFLFDLNACNNISLKSSDELNKTLLHIRLACLRILTDFSNKTSNLRWGYKFFDSCGSVTQKMHKFNSSETTLEAFETLESEICTRYERHISYSQALEESNQKDVNISNVPVDNSKSENASIAPVKILHLALTQLLSEFQWEYLDMWSPSSKKRKDDALYMRKRNFLFLFNDIKDNHDALFNYFGIKSLLTKSKLANILLPQTLREQLLDKADAHWIWLNVSPNQNFLGSLSSRVLPLLSETLQSIQGSLIPLSLLSQSYYHMKLLNCMEKTLFENKASLTSNLCGSFPNSLLPFSSIFLQSLCQPFYLNDTHQNNLYNINCFYKGLKIPVRLIKIFKEKDNFSKEENTERKEKIESDAKSSDITWSKFVIRGGVSRNIKYTTNNMLLCLPYVGEIETSTERSLVTLNKALFLKGINLVLTCITDSGLEIPGLLIPLSMEASIVSILDPFVNLMCKSDFKVLDSHSLDMNEVLENISDDIQNFKTELKTSHDDNTMKKSSFNHFQIETLELWFKPTSAVSSIMSFIKTRPTSSSKLDSFHQLLQQSAQTHTNMRTASKEDVPQTSAVQQNICQTIENDEIFADLNYDELCSTVNELYNSAVESSDDILHYARKVVKTVANYFKKNGGDSFEVNVQNFMEENLLMSVRRISEKYEKMHPFEKDKNKKIKECKMQALLILELETLILPPNRENCVNSVTSLLREMSFYSGAMELNKFLVDILRENYSHNLYEVLDEIGEELAIPLFEDKESSDSPDILLSDLADGEILSPVASSNMSERSSSSTFSQKDNNRKLVRHRSDISDTLRSRQVLLPGASPKKKKSKSSAQIKATRFSPRLASKKNKGQTKAEKGKPRNVRRNLFPKDKFSRTPKKHKNGPPSTPRSKKKCLDVVAETPSHKQVLSASQRRKSFRDQLSVQASSKQTGKSPRRIKDVQEDADVVAETPTFKQKQSICERKNSYANLQSTQGSSKETVKSSKSARNVQVNAKKQLMQKLNQASEASLKPVGASTSNMYRSSSFPQYTPESKGRRLSLHLFSKLLSSPTARMGMKKCTKRLFDHVSPQKSYGNNKKLKPWEESKDTLVEESGSQSNISKSDL